MKKKISLIVVSIMMIIGILSGCGAKNSGNETKDSLEEIKSRGEFVVGLDDSFPPMGFRDDNGEIVGFDIDLAKEAASRMGVKVVFKPVDWDGVILSLKNKDIDVIWNGLTITKKRKAQIGFTSPYIKNRQIIVVQEDSNITTKADLKDEIVGLQMGSSSDEALASDKETLNSLKEVKKYSNNTEALLDLKAGRIQAVVVDEIVGRYYIAKKPGVYKVLEENFGEESYGVGFRKEDTTFGEELNKVLNEMKNDGKADEISKRWFGEAIVEK